LRPEQNSFFLCALQHDLCHCGHVRSVETVSPTVEKNEIALQGEAPHNYMQKYDAQYQR